jgi:hypothetical protein
MSDETPGIKPARPTEPDYDYIADSGDRDAYRAAWEAFPDERETLEMLFPDLHAEEDDDTEEDDDSDDFEPSPDPNWMNP